MRGYDRPQTTMLTPVNPEQRGFDQIGFVHFQRFVAIVLDATNQLGKSDLVALDQLSSPGRGDAGLVRQHRHRRDATRHAQTLSC